MPQEISSEISQLALNSTPSALPFDAIILGNGDFPTHPLPLHLLHQAPFLVCCDGAANKLIALGLVPDVIIGDGDSLDPHLKEKYASRFHHIPDQETNDQTKAVTYVHALGKKHIALLGSTGKREDHMLGNIGLIMNYLPEVQVFAFTDYGVFLPLKAPCTLHTAVGQQISIFNFGATALHATGLRYPLYDFTELWQGTLNEADSTSTTVQAKGPYLLYLNYTY